METLKNLYFKHKEILNYLLFGGMTTVVSWGTYSLFVKAIGMSVGVGMYAVAIIGTLLILLTLIALEVWEHRRRIGQESRVICVKINQVGISADRYKEVLSRNYVQLSTFYMGCNYEQQTTEFNFVVMYRKDVDLQSLFEQLRQIAPTHSIALSTQ